MKKIKYLLGLLIITLSVFGCTLGNTPKKRVEVLLNRYQMNSSNIVTELDDYLKTLTINDNYYEDYKEVYLKQYKDLKYEIKDEKIDGDTAIVTAQIDVYDYYKADQTITDYITKNQTQFSENDIFSNEKSLRYKIDELSKVKDRVTYTIDFELTKVNDSWTINNLTNEELEKIHGTYAH